MGTSIVLINLSFVSNFIGKQRDYFALLALIVTFQVCLCSTSFLLCRAWQCARTAAPAVVASQRIDRRPGFDSGPGRSNLTVHKLDGMLLSM